MWLRPAKVEQMANRETSISAEHLSCPARGCRRGVEPL